VGTKVVFHTRFEKGGQLHPPFRVFWGMGPNAGKAFLFLYTTGAEIVRVLGSSQAPPDVAGPAPKPQPSGKSLTAKDLIGIWAATTANRGRMALFQFRPDGKCAISGGTETGAMYSTTVEYRIDETGQAANLGNGSGQARLLPNGVLQVKFDDGTLKLDMGLHKMGK
jgi:hypothetical protein